MYFLLNMGLFHGYVWLCYNLIWRQSSERLEIELFERSGVCQIKKQSSTSSQTSVFKEQVIFHSFSSVESVATTLRDDINDNSSRVFLGLIVPCLSKCALGHCATCDSDVGNFPSESRRKDPNWLPLQDFFLQMNFWTKEDSFLLRILLKRRPFVILIPWFSTWQSQNSTTFWRKDLPTQLLHGIVGGIY